MASKLTPQSNQVLHSVTGRNGYIINQSLAYAIKAIEHQPSEWQERSNKQDMISLLDARAGNGANLFRLLARAHLERRGVQAVAGQLELADRISDDNVVHLQA